MNCNLRPAFTLLFAIFAGAQSIDAVAQSQDPSTGRTVVPSDAELESRQTRIGRIDIHVDDVFETTQPLATPYRIVNALHIDSRPTTIATQLLFRSGEVFSRRVLEETERLLRSQRYLNGAAIETIEYHEESNTVDLLVRVHDVWTLSPGIAFGRKGGANSSSIEIEENNLLGLGKRVELALSQNVDRSTTRVRYYDPNLLSTRWQLSAAYASSSDGGEKTIDVAQPFYALDTRWSAGVFATDTIQTMPRYSLGEVVEEFAMHRQAAELSGGISDGLQNGWVRRYLAGARYESREFSAFEGQAASLPDDRTIVYPWFGIELLEDKFLKTANLDQIGRTEDIHLGGSARFEIGYAANAFGSTQSATMLKATAGLGNLFGDRQFLINELVAQGRIEEGKIDNGTLELSSRYYMRHSKWNVSFASVSAALASHLDPELQLLLGGDNGLRGYPLRFQAGTRTALLTLEERFYSNWQPLKLFTVGAAAFFDAGRTWGHDEFGGEQFGWLKDVGIGLRLGNARSALGNVLHIDLAYRLDGPNDISKMQIVVETRKSF